MTPSSETLNAVSAVRAALTPGAMARRTRRVYDRLASIYPASSYLFHRIAQKAAIEMSGVRDGSRVLEVGTGSGELFRKLVQHNPAGVTVGIDYSHQMAARTGRTAREMFPSANSFCNTASACSLPLADSSFDFIFSCLMLELLDRRQQVQAFEEFQRVLKPGGRLTIVLIGEDSKVFNWLFVWCVRAAPAFWGAQIEHRLRDILRRTDFRIIETRRVRQNGYPALVLTLEA